MPVLSISYIIFVISVSLRPVSAFQPQSEIFKLQFLNLVNIIRTEGCTPIVLSIGRPNGPDYFEEHLKTHTSFGKEPHIIYHSLSTDLNWTHPLQRPLLRNLKNCIISIISLQDVQPKIFHSLAKTLIPEFNPVLYKDIDKVVFLSSQNLDQRDILKSEDFGKKLKYKVGLSLSSKSYQIFSSCEFCKSSEQVFQVDDKHLVDWPDYEDNFQGTLVKLSAPSTVGPRYNFKADSKNGKYYTTNGVVTYQMHFIQRKLNFTYELKPPEDKAIPGVLVNGSWNGVVADVLSGRADIGVCIAQEAQRCTAATCTSPTFREPVTFVSGRPQKVFVWYAIFWSFSPLVWILLVISSILFALLLALMIRIPRDSAKIHWPLGRIFEYTFGAFVCQTGFFPLTLPSSIKVSLAMWLFGTFIIGTYYLTKLIGFLTFPVVENIPETVDELVHSKFKWGITYVGGALFQLLKGSQNPVFVTLSEKMELLKWRDCVNKAGKGGFICISYEIAPKFLTSTSPAYLSAKPPYIISQKSLFTMDIGLLTQKRAVFLPNLENAIGNFISTGLTLEWEKQDFRNLENLRRENASLGTIIVQQMEQDNNSLLSIKHLQGAFTALIAGLGFACFMAIFEFYIGLKARKAKRRKETSTKVQIIKVARTLAIAVILNQR